MPDAIKVAFDGGFSCNIDLKTTPEGLVVEDVIVGRQKRYRVTFQACPADTDVPSQTVILQISEQVFEALINRGLAIQRQR